MKSLEKQHFCRPCMHHSAMGSNGTKWYQRRSRSHGGYHIWRGELEVSVSAHVVSFLRGSHCLHRGAAGIEKEDARD